MTIRLVSAIYNEFYPFEAMDGVSDVFATREPADLKAGDVLIVWGGEDISPALYKHKVSIQTGAEDYPSRRDTIEWNLMQRAKELNIPIIGVCRGAQMLCALAGGYLIQHVNNHGGYHDVSTYDNKTLRVNSLHHQMMYPFEVDHEMLAWAATKRSNIYVKEHETVDVPLEPEFVYFPQVKGFAMQWHPEMMEFPNKTTEYVFDKIKERLGA